MIDEAHCRVQISQEQQHMLDVLPDSCAIIAPKGSIIAINTAWRAFARENGGETDRCYLGTNYLTLCRDAAGESAILAREVELGLKAVLSRKDEFSCEYPCHSPTEKRWFEVVIRRIDIGALRCAMVIHRNTTVRKLQQIAVEKATSVANELAAIVASSTDAIISFDLNGTIVTWNEAARDLYGWEEEEIVGRSMETLYPPGWEVRIGEYIEKIVAGKLRRFEVVRQTRNGEPRDVWVSAAPVRDAAGNIILISNIHRDITEQKRQAERREAVAQELNHRTKNMLAVIMAIERQTARRAGSVAEFHESLVARLGALAQSNDLLVAGHWTVVGLEELVRRQLSPFPGSQADRISIDGPDVLLQPPAVHSLGMALHELGTNASKYGAFAHAAGRLSVEWRVEGAPGRQRLRLRWSETGYGIERPPEQTGFGHEVLTTLCQRSLSAEVEYRIDQAGAVWSIVIPGEFFETD